MAGPDSGWFPWLVSELNKESIHVKALSMPNTNNPKKKAWVEEIKRAVENEKTEDVVLVGHSLGVPTILRFLEETESDFLGIVLVSGAVKQISKANLIIQTILKRFVGKDFNWEKIKSKSRNIVVIHGKDDKKVPVEHAEILAENLGTRPIVLETGRHLSSRESCYELPEVLEVILEIIHPVSDYRATPQEGN